MFHLTITSIMNRITSIAASYAKTIGYAALALAVTSSMTACNGKIYADLFNNNNSTLLMLLGGKAPTVTFTSTPIINNANKINYTITGTCSEDGQPVVLVVGSGAPPLSVTNSPVCTGGIFSGSSIDVSTVVDGAAVPITATQTNSAGRSKQVSTTVLKDTINPTVSFTSTPAISQTNVSSYSISGDCSDNGLTVPISISDGTHTVTASPTCTGGTFSASGLNCSTINDSSPVTTPSVTITADLTDTAGNTAVQASSTVIKNTASAFVTIDSAPAINIANESSYVISGSCSDNGQPVHVKIAGGTVTANPNCSGGTYTTTGLNVSGLSDSPPSISITADFSDHLGNPAPQASTSVIKDVVAPSGYSVTVDQTIINLGNDTGMSFTFAGAETGTTYTYTVTSSGGGTPVNGTGSISLATQQITGIDVHGLADGTLTLSVTLTDAAGNTGTPATDTITKDASVPSGYSVSINQTYINNANKTAMSFTFASAETGDTYNYMVTSSGGAGTVTGSGTVTASNEQITGIDVSGLPDGTLTLSVTLTDAAGNTGSAATDTVAKDVVKPSGYSVSIDQAAINNSNKNALSFTFAGAEVGTTYHYTITSSGGGGTVTGTGTIATATDKISGINVAGLPDGTLTLSVTLTDTAGNVGDPATDTVAKDVSAPSGYTVVIDQTYINNANKNALSFTFGGAEVGATYNYTITSSGGGTNVTGTGTIATATDNISGIGVAGLNDGTLTITVTLTDPAGNTGSGAQDTATKDVAAPLGYTVSIDQSVINNSNKAAMSFTFATAETGTTYNYSVSSSGGGGTVTGTGTVTSTGEQITGINTTTLPDGTLTLSVTLTDTAGNTGSAATDNVIKDAGVPSGYSVSIDQTAINNSNKNAMSFTFALAETGTTYNYTVSSSGGGTPVSGSGSVSSATQQVTGINVTSLPDGTLTLSVTLTDAANNTGSPATATVAKDANVPSGYSVSIDQAAINNANKTALSFTFAGAEAGTTYNYTISSSGGGGTVTGSGTIATATDNISGISVAGLPDGTLTLSVTLTDTAGNTGSAATNTRQKDVVAPTVAITSPTSGSVSGNTVISFTDDETTNPQVSVNGTNWTSATSGVTKLSDIPQFAGLSDGAITLYLRDTDTAGNIGSNSVSLTKDTVALAISSVQTIDSDHNGKLDHYKITFNKSVKDSTFPNYVGDSSLGTSTADWLVAGYNNRQFVGATYVPDIDASDNVNDTVIYIKFDEKITSCDSSSQAGCDSGDKPDLTTTSTPGLQDLSGNVLAQRFSATAPAESDLAPPIVVKAASINNTSASLTFSENMAAGTLECASSGACSSIYTIPGITVSAAVMSGGAGIDGPMVTLTTSAQTDGNSYTVTVSTSGPTDQATNHVWNTKNTATFTGLPVVLKVQSAASTNNTHVAVTFNDNVKATTAECASAGACSSIYTIAGLTVNAAVMAGGAGVNGTVVNLTTQSQATTSAYTLTVTSGVVTNVSGSASCSTPDNTAQFNGDTLPYVSFAGSNDQWTIDVTFDESVKWDTTATGALLKTNYCIELASDSTPQVCDNPALGANSTFTISSQAAGTVARITTTTAQTAGTSYRVTVQNVVDTTGNSMDTGGDANTKTFTGLENIKILSAATVVDNSSAFTVFKVTFSKAPIIDGGAHAANTLANWSFPSGLNTVTLCTPSDDVACPALVAGATSIYFKATPDPSSGAYTVVGATAAGNCIENASGAAVCLQSAPNDRASLTVNLPENIGQGPVYDDPFNDLSTVSGQVLKYNGKLIIGPNSVDSGVFQVDYNLQNSLNITFDADTGTAGNQAFPGILEHTGVNLAGIDYMYAGCYDSVTTTVDTTLTGTDCTNADSPNSKEIFIVLGYDTSGGNYQSEWMSKNTTSPYIFTHTSGITNAASSYRAMSVQIFKGYVYHATQHQGSSQVRFDRLSVNTTTMAGTPIGGNGLEGSYLNRIGCAGTITNGRACVGGGGELISLDTMFEYDNDGAGGNSSQLYIAAGGECSNTTSPNRCLTDHVRNATSKSDGGILRTALAYLPAPAACTSAADCANKWEDITPDSTNATYWTKWSSYMSIPLPSHAQTGYDWDYIVPSNTIKPALKAIPKMVSFNGDLYMLRNACSSANINYVVGSSGAVGTVAGNVGTKNLTGTGTAFNDANGYGLVSGDTVCVADPSNNATIQCNTVNTVTSATALTVTTNWTATFSGYKASRGNFWNDREVCPSGSEIPQLWRLRKNLGATAANARANWELVAESAVHTGRTDMSGAAWAGGSSQATMCGHNTQATLLVVNGDRLYIGFDNGTDGVNIWRTFGTNKALPLSEADFEAVCQNTSTVCAVPSKQFGWNSGTYLNTKIFDGISVTDGGTPYVVISARNGANPLRIYRTSNN